MEKPPPTHGHPADSSVARAGDRIAHLPGDAANRQWFRHGVDNHRHLAAEHIIEMKEQRIVFRDEIGITDTVTYRHAGHTIGGNIDGQKSSWGRGVYLAFE